jgi:hypothetical protein
MIVRFFDRQNESNPKNGRALECDSELGRVLDGLRDRDPFFFELVGENQYCLLVGLGATCSVQHSSCDGRPPYLMAVAPDGGPSGEYAEFLIGDTLTPVPRRYGLAPGLAKEIVVHFCRTGERSPAVLWEEI